MSEERERIRLRILALRKTIDVYAAYGAAPEVDRLLNEIGDLERQLDQISKRGRKPTERKEHDDARTA
jgi:hypothetical protein